MKNSKQWFSIAELLEKNLDILPKTDKGISKKADREQWLKRQREGVKGKTFEYHFSSLPEGIQKMLGFEPVIAHNKKINHTFQAMLERLAQHIEYIPAYLSLNSASNGYQGNLPDTYMPYATELLRKLGISEKNGAVFWASGDTMLPTIDNNDQLLVDTHRRELVEGKIYVIQHRGKMWIKRIRFGYDTLELISDNRKYEPIVMSYDNAELLDIIGQVVNITKTVAV